MTAIKRAIEDPSLRSLVLVNLLFGAYFIYANGTLGELLWVFWFQSVVIGISNYFRIRRHPQKRVVAFDVKAGGFRDGTLSTKTVATFFALHYGIFHLAYLGFLIEQFGSDLSIILLVGAVLFSLNHFYSFRIHQPAETVRPRRIGSFMFSPYARIIPMQIILIGGSSLLPTDPENILLLISFIVLKTSADAYMHMREHEKQG